MVMYSGNCARSWYEVLLWGHVLRSFAKVMFWGYVPEVMFRVARNGLSWHWKWHFEHELRSLCLFGWPQNTTGCDMLLVGTPANFLASNVEKNSDLFYKDVSEREQYWPMAQQGHLIDKRKNIIKWCRISAGHIVIVFIKALLLNKFSESSFQG